MFMNTNLSQKERSKCPIINHVVFTQAITNRCPDYVYKEVKIN